MHRNKITDKVYIGATCLKPKKRWANGKGYMRNKKFYEDIINIGWDNFEHLILEDNLDKESSKLTEIYYISKYKNNCYNKTKGGEQGNIKYDTQEEYEQRIKEYDNYYYNKNRETIIKRVSERQKERQVEITKYQKRYYYDKEEYRQYKIEYQRKYRKEHKQEINEYNKKYQKERKLTNNNKNDIIKTNKN